MSTISLRLPESLHNQLRKVAQQDNISMNQFITLALAEKLSALAAERYFRERAERADRLKFEGAMAKVADVDPEKRDSL